MLFVIYTKEGGDGVARSILRVKRQSGDTRKGRMSLCLWTVGVSKIQKITTQQTYFTPRSESENWALKHIKNLRDINTTFTKHQVTENIPISPEVSSEWQNGSVKCSPVLFGTEANNEMW